MLIAGVCYYTHQLTPYTEGCPTVILVPMIWVSWFLLTRQSMLLCTLFGLQKDFSDLNIESIVLDELPDISGWSC